MTSCSPAPRRLGADPRNTNYAGGNTSAKGSAIDPVTGEPVELLWVKGSGGDLGTLAETGLAVLRLDRLRALQGTLPGRRARGRDGRRIRLLSPRPGRCRAVDRHRDARPDRRRPRGPPPSGLGHRPRDGGRRPGADPALLRRSGGLGRLAPPWVPARPRHRRDPTGPAGGDRGDPRRPRDHGVGCDLRGVRGRLARHHPDGRSRSSRTTGGWIRSGPSSPATSRCRRTSGITGPPPCSRLSAGWSRRIGHRSATTRTARSSSTFSAAPSIRVSRRSGRRARTISCGPRSGRSSSTSRARPASTRSGRACASSTQRIGPTTAATTTSTRPPTARRSAAPTRRSCSSPVSGCSRSVRTSRRRASPASSTSTRST